MYYSGNFIISFHTSNNQEMFQNIYDQCSSVVLFPGILFFMFKIAHPVGPLYISTIYDMFPFWSKKHRTHCVKSQLCCLYL